MADTTFDLELRGCAPEPLMAYLKALAVLRLVSEQKDPDARGWWKNDVFCLRSKLDREALVKFLLEEYKPTPIVVPWSGDDFFAVDWKAQARTFRKTPTSSKAIEAVLATQTERFEAYRQVLRACRAALKKCGIDRKDQMERRKWAFIRELRSSCNEPRLIEWIDAAAVTTVEKFAALVGSGGGSDGNTHFSDNFMQNLWDVLADFDAQRGPRVPRDDAACRAGLRSSLFGEPGTFRIEKRTSSLFDSGAGGGPNATQGLERKPLSNPWDVILALEGTISFAGAATRRFRLNADEGAFPFQVSASVTTHDRLADKEQAGSEVWLPHWTRPARSDEVLALLREGRAHCGSRPAKTGIDIARAIASLGVDRGIAAFTRYAIVKGRVGGENYNTAVPLGRFQVIERADVDLLREADPWLDGFRRAAGGKNAPPRFASALRQIDSAILDFCKYGGKALFQQIIVALGRAERELALTSGKVGQRQNPIPALTGLTPDWLDAANDDSHEFIIARALAGIYDPQEKIGPLRANLEPVDWKNRCRAWAEKGRCVVWNAGDLATNLANVLQRRMMDGMRAGCERLPLASRFTVPPGLIAAFIAGDLDDERIEQLIWGLMLVDQEKNTQRRPQRNEGRQPGSAVTLPRDYALLKLLFLPAPLVPERAGENIRWRYMESGLMIRPEPRILPLLRAGRIGEACRIAAQRLRVSGLPPMPGSLPTGITRDNCWSEETPNARRTERLAAALLIPISSRSVNQLVHFVCRDQSAAIEPFGVSAEGESE